MYLKPFHIAFRPMGEELVRTIKVVKTRKIKDFYNLYAPALYGIILRMVKTEKLAELILRDVFLNEIKSMHDCAPNGKLFALLANTARSLSREKLKEISHLNSIGKRDERPQAEYYIVKEIGLTNHQLSHVLNIDQPSVLEMIYFEGYTYIEAAEKLNISIETLKIRLRGDMLGLRR